MAQAQVFDREKITFNIVRLKKGGETFEVVLEDPNAALRFRQGDTKVDVASALKAEDVFKDARKGLGASAQRMKELFGTENPVDVAKIILREGEFHLTAEQKKEILAQKMKEVVEYIHTNAMDPRTKLPHPKTRIELAIEEAGLHIDACNSVASQLDEIISKLRPIIPMSFESVHIRITIPARHTGKAYSALKSRYQLTNERWLNDGSVQFEITTAAGAKLDIFNLVNGLTHGEAQIEEVK